MNIYIVIKSEDYEGGHVLEPFTTRIVAEQFVEKYIQNTPRPFTKDEATDCWVKGCDYITIEEYRLCEKIEDSIYFDE